MIAVEVLHLIVAMTLALAIVRYAQGKISSDSTTGKDRKSVV